MPFHYFDDRRRSRDPANQPKTKKKLYILALIYLVIYFYGRLQGPDAQGATPAALTGTTLLGTTTSVTNMSFHHMHHRRRIVILLTSPKPKKTPHSALDLHGDRLLWKSTGRRRRGNNPAALTGTTLLGTTTCKTTISMHPSTTFTGSL